MSALCLFQISDFLTSSHRRRKSNICMRLYIIFLYGVRVRVVICVCVRERMLGIGRGELIFKCFTFPYILSY